MADKDKNGEDRPAAAEAWQELFLAAGDPLLVVDAGGRVVAANPAACAFYGHSAERLTGLAATQLVAPVSLGAFQGLVAGDAASTTGVIDAVALHADGTPMPVEFRRLAVDLNDRSHCLLFIKLPAAAPSGEEDLWSIALDHVDDAMYLIGLDDRLLRANQAFYRLSGFVPSQVLGRDITTIMHPQGEAVPCPVCLARRQQRDEIILLAEDHPDNPFARPIRVSVKVMRGKDGSALAVLMGVQDLSGTAGLHRQNRMISQLSEGVIVANAQGGITEWNQGAERLLGHAAAEMLGTPLSGIFTGKDAELVADLFRAAGGSEAVIEREMPLRTKGGGQIFCKISLAPLPGTAGSRNGVIFSFSDFSTGLEYEDQLHERIKLFAISVDVARALTSGETLRQTLQRCCELLVMHLDVAFARIWLYDAGEDLLALQASAGLYTHIDGLHSRIPMLQSYKIATIALDRRPHLTNQVVGDPQVRDQEWAKREGMVAFAGHPLLVEDRVIGVVAVFSKRPLSEATLSYLAVMADEVALGVVRKQHEEQLQNVNRALRTLSACNEILVRAQTEKQFLQDICRAITSSGGYHLAWIGFAELTSRKNVVPVAQAGFDDGYLEEIKITWDDGQYGQGPTGTAIRTGKTVVCADIMVDASFTPWREQARRRGYASSIALPLQHEGRPLGAINIYARETFAFSHQEVQLLHELTSDVMYGILSLRAQQQHRRASEELRRKSAEFEAIYNAIPDAVIFVDTEGRIVMANPAVRSILGYERDEMVGMLAEFFEASRQPIAESGKEADASFEQPGEMEYRRKDGSVFPAETVLAVVRDDQGEVLGKVAIIRDVSEKKQSERERERLQTEMRRSQKMEALGTLAGGIAHDFNNILAAIMGYTEFALHSLPDNNAIRQDLQHVAKAGLRARELVKQILAFSRRSDQELKPVELALLVKEVLKLLRASIPANIEFRQEIESDAGAVLADPSQLHQVAMNLCTNAYHAMRDQGKGTLRVELHGRSLLEEDVRDLGLKVAPGEYLELVVADTGVGMVREVLERIFEPYFTTKERGEGTGLGLAVVHGIIINLGGDVVVHSVPGEGSSFHVFLPKALESVRESAALFSQVLPTGSGRVLLVDDEEVVASVMKKMIAGLGYSVTSFVSSEEALQAFEKSPNDFDLVFTDMAMPGMTGEELSRRIHAVRPAIPVVLCTGFSESMNEKTAREAGISRLILKPVLLRDVAAALSEAMAEGGKA